MLLHVLLHNRSVHFIEHIFAVEGFGFPGIIVCEDRFDTTRNTKHSGQSSRWSDGQNLRIGKSELANCSFDFWALVCLVEAAFQHLIKVKLWISALIFGDHSWCVDGVLSHSRANTVANINSFRRPVWDFHFDEHVCKPHAPHSNLPPSIHAISLLLQRM